MEHFVAHKHSNETEDSANGVKNFDGFLLCEAHVNESVVEMSSVSGEGALSGEQTADDRECSVCKGKSKDYKGHDK